MGGRGVIAALPDTALVKEASALARATLTPLVLAHSTRTFLLARAYGEKRKLRFDEEGLMLAALFHDFGLADSLRDRARAFTEVSAGSLREFLAGRGAERNARLEQAIAMHMQLFPRWSRGAEVGLLQVGAWMDVVGLRGRAVDLAYRREVEEAFPRAGFALEFHKRLFKSLGSFRSCYRLVISPDD
jgi:HD domain